MLLLTVLGFFACSNLVSHVTATDESARIQPHDKEITKRSDGLMHELVNLLADEKFHRKTNEMVDRMVKQNKKILKQFAGFSTRLKGFEKKLTTEMKIIKKELGVGKTEQENTRKTIKQIQKNIRDLSSTHDIQAIKKTTTLLSKQMESEINKINYKITMLKTSVSVGKTEQENTRKTIKQIQKNIRDLSSTHDIQAIKKTTTLLSKQLESEINKINYKITTLKTSVKNGAVYIRWGRTRCPSKDTKLVYSGFAAGAWYANSGGTNTQCLPKNPNWRKYHDAANTAAYIYGAEYETHSYSVGEALHNSYWNYDVPCAVCQSKKRHNVHMIPAKDRCDNGWHLEYRGYLMTQLYNQGSSNYLCVDANPEKIGSNRNQNGRLFYPVESICGTLPCPPYVNNRELTCAVCTF